MSDTMLHRKRQQAHSRSHPTGSSFGDRTQEKLFLFHASCYVHSSVRGGIVKCLLGVIVLLSILASLTLLAAKDPTQSPVALPSSKVLTSPAPGRLGATNNFPATIALSPDGRYAATLN